MTSPKTDSEYDRHALGIVSTAPGLSLGEDNGQTGGVITSITGEEVTSGQAKVVPIALSGRVPVKANLENGPIVKGDAITTSSVAGVGMKATSAGKIVGYALEDFTENDADGKVLVFVSNEFYQPTLADMVQIVQKDAGTYGMDENGDIIGLTESDLASTSAVLATDTQRQGILATLQALGNTATDSLSAASANIYGKLNAFEIDVTNLKIAGVSLDEYVNNLIAQSGSPTSITPSTDEFSAHTVTVTNDAGQVVSQLDRQGNATFSGTLRAQNIIANDMDSRYLTAQDLLVNNATVSGTLTADSARIASLEAQNATVSGTLYADRIETSLETRQISDFELRVRDLIAREMATQTESSPSALLADAATLETIDQLTGTATTTDEFGTLDTTTATSSGTLIANGGLTQVDGDLDVTNLLTADLAAFKTSLSIKETFIGESFLSFNTQNECADSLICNTFAIQPSGEGKLSLMADALVITKDGGVVVNTDLTINGKILAKGGVETNSVKALDGKDLEINLAKTASESATLATTRPTELIIRGDDNQEVAAFTASGSARFNKVVIAADNSINEIGFDGVSTSYESNATTGTAILPAGKLMAVINNPNVTDSTLIYVTPQGSTSNQVLYVANKTADDQNTSENEASFTVAIDATVGSDVTFTYWLVETQPTASAAQATSLASN